MRRGIVALMVLLGAAALAYLGVPGLWERFGWIDARVASSRGGEAAAPGGRYQIAPITRGDIRQTVTTAGTLNALVTVEVGTQLSGQIAQLFVDFDDEVVKGQPLAQLDRKTFDARLAEASAATEVAHATVTSQRRRVERARSELRDVTARRAALAARLEQARVRLRMAETTLKRSEALGGRGMIAVTQAEEARTARDSAAAGVREADSLLAAHEAAIDGARIDLARAEADLATAQASVPQKQALARSAQIDVERTTIRSPIDGVVVGRKVSEGQTVAASLEAPTLFTIAGDLRQMEIYARVDEADIGKIRPRQQAAYTVSAYPGRQFAAEVASVRKASEVKQNVVTYTVVLSTQNLEKLLLPGMTATVRITVQEQKAALKLPLVALRFAPSGGGASAATAESGSPTKGRPAAVWRLVDGELQQVTVGVGPDDGTHAAILDGPLGEGDGVVVGEVAGSAPRRLFGLRFGF